MHSRLDYPKTPPKWIGSLPYGGSLNDLFPSGIRNYASRMLMMHPVLRLQWNDHSLTITIENHRCVWRLTQNKWTRNCSCGYKNDCCIHAFAAAKLFHEIAAKEGWNSNCSKGGAHSGGKHRSRQNHNRSRPSNETAQRSVSPVYSSQKGRYQPCLEVEVDRNHQEHNIAIRVYLFDDNQRQLLRMQRLLNLCLQIQRKTTRMEFQEDDLRFLRFVTPFLRNTPAVINNLYVLTLSKERFKRWLRDWEDRPARFIDRDTQQPLTGKREKLPMHFQLAPQEEWVEISAVLTLPAGKSICYHEALKQLANPSDDVTINGRLFSFDPPVSRNLLNEIFSKKSPRLRKIHVAEHLSTILEGRLDLVRGPTVQHRRKEGKLTLSASTSGAEILLKASIRNTPIFRDRAFTSAGVSVEADRILITNYENPQIDAVKSFLRDAGGNQSSDGAIHVSGKPEDMKTLIENWKQLPEDINKTCTKEAANLLEPSSPAVASVSVLENGNFVQTSFSWKVNASVVSDREMCEALANGSSIIRTENGSWLQLDLDQVKAARENLVDSGFESGRKLFRFEAKESLKKIQTADCITLNSRSSHFAEVLILEEDPPLPALPVNLDSILRPYQREGFQFLADRFTRNVGAILADDMGLGKTLQLLSLITACKESGIGENDHRALVVCPASVSSVWMDQAAMFTPSLTTALYAGAPDQRGKILKKTLDLVVVNYSLLRNDLDDFLKYSFDIVILDEAQQIKNPDAQISQAVKQLKRKHSIAATGTPLENRLLDLWSISEFTNPGLLSDRNTFINLYEKAQRTADTAKRIAPTMLRRTKDIVAKDLPSRTEEILLVEFSESEQQLYHAALLEARENVKELGPIQILASLTRLRRLCCHPALVTDAFPSPLSSKLETVMEMLETLLEENHSALIFSQFTGMLDIMAELFRKKKIPHKMLTGKTPVSERGKLVKEFSESPEPEVFLLSLKAAGSGLTLTKADYVFIFDPWWNPAAERQAIDRTHRIGQDKPVIAYRLAVKGTVEEKVLKLQQEKSDLYKSVLDEADENAVHSRLSADDLQALLEL